MYDYLYINLGLNSICFAFFRKRNASIRGVSSNLFCYTYKEQTDAHEHTDSHYNNFVHPPKIMRIFLPFVVSNHVWFSCPRIIVKIQLFYLLTITGLSLILIFKCCFRSQTLKYKLLAYFILLRYEIIISYRKASIDNRQYETMNHTTIWTTDVIDLQMQSIKRSSHERYSHVVMKAAIIRSY